MNDHQHIDWLAQRKRLGLWLSENCGKPANTLNGVSFDQLIRSLNGGGV